MKDGKIDRSALARHILKYEEKYRELKEMERAIEQAILQIGETQIVGNVEAKYRKGRVKRDYQKAVEDNYVPDYIKEKHKTVKEYYSWKKICEEAEIDEDLIPSEVGEPSVSITVKED